MSWLKNCFIVAKSSWIKYKNRNARKKRERNKKGEESTGGEGGRGWGLRRDRVCYQTYQQLM